MKFGVSKPNKQQSTAHKIQFKNYQETVLDILTFAHSNRREKGFSGSRTTNTILKISCRIFQKSNANLIQEDVMKIVFIPLEIKLM